MLYAVNPVGFVSVVISDGVSILTVFGGRGSGLQPHSPIIAVILPPVLSHCDERALLPAT